MNFQEALINSLKKNAENIAIISNELSVTYSELFDKSNQITAYLLDIGIAPGTYIGLIVENRTDFIASMIGAMNARCVFVPIDNTLPNSRIEHMVDQLALEYVISSSNSETLPFEIPNVLPLDRILAIKNSPSLKYPIYDEEDSLYVYFTSGSTGVPKGVIGKNKSLLQFVNWEINAFNIDKNFKFSQFISPYFDAFLRDVFVPLLSGASICVPPSEEDFFSPEKMMTWIDEQEISLIHCVPSLFKVFSDEKQLNDGLYKSLEYVLLSGEKIIPLELEPWYNNFGERIQLVNLYGTTETTMIRSFYKIKAADIKKSKMPIGKPIDDTELLILNKSLKPNAILIPGDLYIASDYITKGYLNNKELTDSKFIEIETGMLAFKTGDKAKLLPDGNIELLGREDRQIKLRGIRVELDELEIVLSKSSLIDKIVVVSHMEDTDLLESQTLIAYVKKKEIDSEHLDFIESVEEYARQTLPKYSIPSRFIEVETFPLLSSGKIDFKKLATLSEENEKIIVAAIDETEKKLLVVWNNILGDIPISTDDSFLKIGGNSLSLMRLIAKIYAEFSVRIPLGELFKNLSIQQQAAFINQSIKTDDHFKIERVENKELYHLSNSQKRMYLNYDIDRNNLSYNMPYIVEVMETPDAKKIEDIFLTIIQRHEALRTIFEINEEGVFQKVLDNSTFRLEEIQAKEVDEGVSHFIRPFKLHDECLFRAGIIYTDDKKSYLIIDLHHIIADGVSQRNMFTEFLALYDEKTLNQLPLQYKDYAEWEYKFSASDAYISQREFWLKSFEDGVPKLKLPTTNDTNSKTSNEGGNIIFHIEKDSIAPMMNELKKDNNTAFSVLYSCFITFLLQLTGQEDFVVGIASTGRVQEEVQDTIGMFVKTLPIRYRLELYKSFRTTVKNVNAHLIEAMNKQLYDLTDIIKEVEKDKQNNSSDLFNVMFTFQNYGSGKVAIDTTEFKLHYYKKMVAKFPISFTVSEIEGAYEFAFEYQEAYFSEEDIHTLIDVFKNLIVDISEDIDQTLYDIISDEEVEVNPIESDITFNF